MKPPRQLPKNELTPARKRSIEDCRIEDPNLAYHESEDVAFESRLLGIQEGRALLASIRQADPEKPKRIKALLEADEYFL